MPRSLNAFLQKLQGINSLLEKIALKLRAPGEGDILGGSDGIPFSVE